MADVLQSPHERSRGASDGLTGSGGGRALGPGDCLAGRYRLSAAIGYGGMGRVYRARDEALDRWVAIKLLDDEHSAGTSSASAAEARAAARLCHPGIVQVFDVGQQDGTGYIVMELVPGQSLRELLRAHGRLEPAVAVDLAAQVADALEAAHQHGLVHCDVTPRNILLSEAGHAKLIDFGIAYAGEATRTQPMEEIRGSAAYLAPEQARGERLDGRADVYALGAVLYELLVGQAPFGGSSATEVVTQRLVADPPSPRARGVRIAPTLERVVMRALARDPARRYPSAAALRDALDAEREPRRMVVPPRLGRRTLLAGLEGALHGPQRGARVPLPLLGLRVPLLGLVLALLVCAAPVAYLLHIHAQATAPGVPRLVGHRVSELPALLEQADIAPADVTVQTRPVEPGYVGLVVDQQPQPGLPRDPSGSLQIAVGVPG